MSDVKAKMPSKHVGRKGVFNPHHLYRHAKTCTSSLENGDYTVRSSRTLFASVTLNQNSCVVEQKILQIMRRDEYHLTI